ncbi:transcriptional regulator FilR1 domain-containing protein [Methanobacterium sp.]|jgi:predicted transcriptional regulator|uniref:helix-turn-helix transcriptional regulator n=1 Tax=Methanobacterium sp. TaxID=2164 RepID=UPI0031587DDF
MAPEDIFELYEEIKEDLKFITSSDIRAKIIISLKEGPKKLGDLKNEVHMRSSSILHSMSQLETKNLITREFQSYSLSQTGEMAATVLIDMVNSFYLIKENENFWLNHDITEIPEDLMGKIDDLSGFKIITFPDFSEKSPFQELLLDSKVIKGIISPLIIYDELEVVNKKEDIHLILANNNSNEVIEKLKFQDISITENIKLWKINGNLKLILIVTDNFILLNLPQVLKNDSISYLVSKTEESIEWGNKLFNHYLSQAEELNI